MKKKAKLSIIVPSALLVFYIASYAIMSVNGRYEPSVVGPSGVKSWAWAPASFAPGGWWKPKRIYAFGPLYILDTRFWHKDQYCMDDPNQLMERDARNSRPSS